MLRNTQHTSLKEGSDLLVSRLRVHGRLPPRKEDHGSGRVWRRKAAPLWPLGSKAQGRAPATSTGTPAGHLCGGHSRVFSAPESHHPKGVSYASQVDNYVFKCFCFVLKYRFFFFQSNTPSVTRQNPPVAEGAVSIIGQSPSRQSHLRAALGGLSAHACCP